MRSAIVFGMTAILSAPLLAAEEPIPQDHAKMEARERDRIAWNRKTLVDAYDKVGKKSPGWDRPARETLDLAVKLFSQQVDPIIELPDLHAPAKKAVDAGCDDPLILYLYARSSVGPHFPGNEEYAKRLRTAADAMAKSAYSPFRRAVAVTAASQLDAWKPGLTPDDKRKVGEELDAVLDLLAKSVAEDPRNLDWEQRWFAYINEIIAARRKLGEDARTAFDHVDARLAKVPKIEALRLSVKGHFLMHWGWEARTTAFAVNVGQNQFATFESRVRQGKAALEEAYKVNPDEPRVASTLLDIEKSIGRGDRKAMEMWFERAMKADGNDEEACWSKLDWLDPKWHGDDEGKELLAFGEACRATKNWRAKITLLAADAHNRYMSKLPRTQWRAYMGSPEVWKVVREVYDEYLKHYPNDDVERSKYAALCYYAGRYPDAHAEFQRLGDRLTTWPRFPNLTLPMLQQVRDDVARSVGQKPAAQPKPRAVDLP